MASTDVIKIARADGTPGPSGAIALAAGTRGAMRLWRDEEPGDAKPPSIRPYETIGFVLAGRAELHLDGDVVTLENGDSWVVPEGTSHTYKILETFSAIETISPPTDI